MGARDDRDCRRAVAAYFKALRALIAADRALAAAEDDERVARRTLEAVDKTLAKDPGNSGLQAAHDQAVQQLADAKAALAAARTAANAAGPPARAAQRDVLRLCPDAGEESLALTFGRAVVYLPVTVRYTRKLDEALRVLARLPRREVDGVGEVRVEKGDGPSSTFTDHASGETRDGVVVGRYDQGDVTIYYGPHLRDKSGAAAAAVLKHEVGHGVFARLPGGAQTDWTSFWGKNLPSMPGAYARDNAEDGFCESYEAWRDGKPLARAVVERLKGLLKQLP